MRRVLTTDLAILLAIAAAKLLLHVVTNGQYGFHRDELQTLDDARHLDWGFVTYPPLTPFFGRIALTLFGTSLRGFRFFAALAVSIAVVLTGLIARDLGGSRAAQVVASLATAISTIALAAGALFQYVAFDFLWWVAVAYGVARLIATDDRRWWIFIGVAIGLGVQTKYTMAFCVAGVVAGVLFTNRRGDLRSKWLWAGAILSLVIAAPNLIWQMQHDFISLEFLRSIHARDVRIGRADHFLLEQLYVAANPVTIPLWIAGIVFLVRTRRYRIFAWMAAVPFALFLIAQGRGYYTGPIYPMVLAGGAVAIESWLRSTVGRVVTAVALSAGASMALIAMPVAPFGSAFYRFASGINGDLREEVGWPELVQTVAGVYHRVPPAERPRTAILALNYGEAGAVNLYGPQHGLPQAISTVNSFWARGYGDPPPQTLIILGTDLDDVRDNFRSCAVAGRNPMVGRVENEETTDHPDILLCRDLKGSWPELWKRIRRFG